MGAGGIMTNTKGPIGPAIPLRHHINVNYDGNVAKFARANGLKNPQQAHRWLAEDWIVVNGRMHSPRREVV